MPVDVTNRVEQTWQTSVVVPTDELEAVPEDVPETEVVEMELEAEPVPEAEEVVPEAGLEVESVDANSETV